MKYAESKKVVGVLVSAVLGLAGTVYALEKKAQWEAIAELQKTKVQIERRQGALERASWTKADQRDFQQELFRRLDRLEDKFDAAKR